MRQTTFKENGFYRLSNHGAGGARLFLDDDDCARFLFLIIHLQSPTRIYNVSWYSRDFLKQGSFRTKEHTTNTVVKERSVELLSFLIMPEHFDLLIKNLEEGVASVYMHRVLTAYSKYFNSKYKKTGHVFGGSFASHEIKNSSELTKLSAVLHRSSKSLEKWQKNFDKYPWSSLQDYTNKNRWGNLLVTNTVLKHFDDPSKYLDFVLNSKGN